jgi:hypothetical protein
LFLSKIGAAVVMPGFPDVKNTYGSVHINDLFSKAEINQGLVLGS